MVLSWIWTAFVAVSILCAALSGNAGILTAAAMEGAGAGVTLAIGMAGAICLWSGVGALMEKTGITALLSTFLAPILSGVFPSSRKDPALAGALCANVCANFLGLGNAATPMGIRAAKLLKQGDAASDELCRLVVLNTASIQLLPTNVAAVRSALGSPSPMSILPAVWISSALSATLGVAAACVLGKLWKK